MVGFKALYKNKLRGIYMTDLEHKARTVACKEALFLMILRQARMMAMLKERG